ncbi:MAG TPA: hypothetical protein VFA56_05345 [Gaiellaceae bacterium]|nr:hypothetical protein [Gaiellaceae bacterium]
MRAPADAPPRHAGRRGAYGFRLTGAVADDTLLVDADEAWPALELVSRRDAELPEPAGEAAQATVTFGNAGARLQLGPSVVIDLVREPASATFRTRDALDGRALLHPYLGAAASVAAAWHGRESLHAGAFVHRGRAWGVLGERTAGKSSLLAVLHELGRPIVADDILVLDGLAALAAPRSVDLRREAAEALGIGVPLGRVGTRERWRVELRDVSPAVELAGWVWLGWGDAIEVATVGARERLRRIASQLTIPNVPARADALLELAALPGFELRRPRDWGVGVAAANALLDTLD